jgi:hypothetical protein
MELELNQDTLALIIVVFGYFLNLLLRTAQTQ